MGEISTETENEGVIHRDVTKNEAENIYSYEEVIDECPDYTSQDMVQDCVNGNMDDNNNI